MSHGKQFTLYTHISGPNGWKVSFALNILGLTYEPIYLDFANIKSPEHTKYNPNGRVPTLIDHKNNDVTVWESDAVLLYLTEKYDTEYKITVPTVEEKAVLTQWLFFQASGQGPYYDQAIWFSDFAPEKIPFAVERYRNETRRVLSVLEGVLSKKERLVGGKFTVADLSFMTWNNILTRVLEDGFDLAKEFPHTAAWHAKVIAVDGVKQGLAERARLISEEERQTKAGKA